MSKQSDAINTVLKHGDAIQRSDELMRDVLVKCRAAADDKLWAEGEPPRVRIYNVVYFRDNFPKERYTSFGYWDGQEWQMVHECSDYQRVDNYHFSDHGRTVTHYLPNERLPKLP